MRINRFEFRSFNTGESEEGFTALDWAKPMVAEEKIPEPVEEITIITPELFNLTEDELKARENAGYERGYIEGRGEGYQSAKAEEEAHLKSIEEALRKIVFQLAGFEDEFRKSIEIETASTLKLALSIARKIVNTTIASETMNLLEAEVRKCISIISGSPRLLIHVHPELVEQITARTCELAQQSGFSGEIAVRAADGLELADIRISWQNGKVERNTEKLWEEIESILARAIPNTQTNPGTVE